MCLRILLWNVGIRAQMSPVQHCYRRCPYPSQYPLLPRQAEPWMHLRPRLDAEGAHFIATPAHGLEGGRVITQLSFPAQEVLLLEDSQPRVTVVLQHREQGETTGRPVGSPGASAAPPPAPALVSQICLISKLFERKIG